MYISSYDSNYIYVRPRDKEITGDRVQQAHTVLKQLQSGAYDAASGWYIFYRNDANIQLLHGLAMVNKYTFDEYSPKYSEVPVENRKLLAEHPKLQFLREYQRTPIAFADARHGRMLLGDGTGLGKTVTAIGYFVYRELVNPGKDWPILVVTTASTKYQWASEFERFSPKKDIKVVVCDGMHTVHEYPDADVVVLNYALLANHVITEKSKNGKVNRYVIGDAILSLAKTGFNGLIVDECQHVKNSTTKISKAIQHLLSTRYMNSVLMLSATPLENRPVELFNILSLLRPDIWRNYKHFTERYCDAHPAERWVYRGKKGRAKQKYTDVSGAINLDELHQLLVTHVLFRRGKKEALPDLPAAQPVVIGLNLSPSDEREYSDIMSGKKLFVNKYGEEKEMDHPAVRMSYLRQFAGQLKVDYAITFIKDFLEVQKELDAEDRSKLVVFTEHHTVIDTLYEEFKKISVLFDGRKSAKAKEEAKTKFMDDDNIQVFFGQITASGEGLDGLQTVSNTALFVEFPYRPTQVAQCIGRIERSGTNFDSSTVYFPIWKNTVEDTVMSMLVNKEKNILQVLDGTHDSDVSSSKVPERVTFEIEEYLKANGLAL